MIRERDILACDNRTVRFRFHSGKSGRLEQRSVPGADFLWLILQHVLPKGLRRARDFGFLHPNCKRPIALLQVLLRFDPGAAKPPVGPRPPMLCACCGAVMTIVRMRIRSVASVTVKVQMGKIPMGKTPIPTAGTL